MKNTDSHSIFYYSTLSGNLLDIFEIYSGMNLDTRIKCFHTIGIWPIQIHQHFLAVCHGTLSNKWKAVIAILFSTSTATANLSEILEQHAAMHLENYHKVFSHSLNKANSDTSIYLSNVSRNIVKVMKNSNFHIFSSLLLLLQTCLTVLSYNSGMALKPIVKCFCTNLIRLI